KEEGKLVKLVAEALYNAAKAKRQMYKMSSDHSSGAAGLQDLTECPICYERFERPLQLSCGHSYCSKCVDTLRVLSPQSQFGGTNDEYEVGCPECRRVTKVPPGGLPLNYRLQDLIAHVSSEGGEKVNTPRDDAEEKCLLKCLVCNQSMDKGVYMLCRTCAYEHENMSQMCSLCCLRSHNGHNIVERPFVPDIN
ncbi:zinc finger, C3HC4 type, partial [Oesophagostomum dentatum]